MNLDNNLKKIDLKNIPPTKDLIERGFVPKNGKIDILFIFPPTSVAGRYGRKSLGNIGGNSIPLGIACLAIHERKKNIGVGVLDCPGLGIDSEEVFEIIKTKNPDILAFSTTTYSLI